MTLERLKLTVIGEDQFVSGHLEGAELPHLFVCSPPLHGKQSFNCLLKLFNGESSQFSQLVENCAQKAEVAMW